MVVLLFSPSYPLVPINVPSPPPIPVKWGGRPFSESRTGRGRQKRRRIERRGLVPVLSLLFSDLFVSPELVPSQHPG